MVSKRLEVHLCSCSALRNGFGFGSLAAMLAGKCQPSERCDTVRHCEEEDRAELHREENLFYIHQGRMSKRLPFQFNILYLIGMTL